MSKAMIIKSAPTSASSSPWHATATWLLLATCVAGQSQSPTMDVTPTSRDVRYELIISETAAQPAGSPAALLVVNGTSPGPVLRFTEGDTAHITVKNRLVDEDTSIHWHGLLVPNNMDGVPYLTTPPIPPGGERTFEFTLRQSGTYWYHSHTGLQEQRGVQGAIVIEPRKPDVA
ncbi:MAG: FtsP/CotA-like multicopper oxidase with cupredoxin domain, partial [Hyphomicrobiaceae bacterium]